MATYKVPKSITSAAKIQTAISRAKETLVKRAKKSGLYENFGKAEGDAIQEAFISLCDYSNEALKKRSQLQGFREWAAHFSLDELN